MSHRILLQKLIIAFFICLSLWVVSAQESTPIPTATVTPEGPAFVYTWSAEVYYPAIVRFNVVLDRPLDSIRSATLSIQSEGQDAVVIQLNPQDIAVFADEFTELSYIWEITSSNVPPYDSLVHYDWLITTTQDGAGGFSGAFIFEDGSSTWMSYEDPESQINLLLPDDPDLNANTIWLAMRTVYNLMAQNTSQTPTFNIALFTNNLPLNPCSPNANQIPIIIEPRSEQEYICDSSVVESSFRQIGYTTLQARSNRAGDIQDALSNYLFRNFYANLWQNEEIPSWFREGLRQFYLPISKLGLLETLRLEGRRNQLMTLTQLQDFTVPQQANTLITAQSYGLVLYIAHQIGFDGLYNFATQLNTSTLDTSFASIYESNVGQPLGGLLLNFNNWIYTDVAQSDFNALPYQEPTALPSNTPTSTPFPPTPSFTPTATPTYTPTATVTGFLSATPLPSLTPTPTRRSQQPTNTPRSATSLQQPQPESGNGGDSQSTAGNFSTFGILLIGGGIIVLGIGFALIFRNNRGG